MTQPLDDDVDLLDEVQTTKPADRARHAGHVVTAILVCHDGAQWLPQVLDALAAQTRRPERFVAADTASTDASARIVADVLGPSTVVSLDRDASYAEAVQAGLDAFGAPPTAGSGGAVEWIWLLHDDCAPEPTALDELLVRVTHSPSVWMVGPKVRSWDGERLLEAGLTIDGTGHVDTGVDGIELDQGQLDDSDEVLAVSTAGALVRRDIWDRLGGLDPVWQTYADDVDLGWRVNAAGGRVVVATRAILRHVRAQSSGLRGPAISPSAQLVARRRAGMQVVLTNTAGWLMPLLVLRYVLGGIARAAGLLVLARRPGQALAELRAVAGVIVHFQTVLTGRRERSGPREVPHREMRHLFPRAARRWRSSPLRLAQLSGDRAVRVRRTGSSETGPVSEEAESLTLDESVVGRFLKKPATVLFIVMSLLALVADRHVLGGSLHGGRLLPAPGGARDLWSSYTAGFHPSGVGSFSPSPPWLAVLAVLSTIALGKVWFVVDVLILGAVPLSALSAYTAARPMTTAVRVRLWVAIAYALLPAVTGAVAGGRLDVTVAAILLPQVLRATVSALTVEAGRLRWRAAIGAGLLLAVLVAFAPLLWLVAVPALVVGIGVAELDSSEARSIIPRLLAAATVLLLPVIVLLPWSAHALGHPRALIAGSGLPEFYGSVKPPSGLSLVLLRAGGPAQPPIWIGIGILAAGLLGLNRQSRVAIARTGIAMLIVGTAVAAAMTRGVGVTPGFPDTRHWPGLVLLVAGAGALLAALVAAVGARPALSEQSFGWRQPAAVAIVVLAVVSTATLAVGWVVRGTGGPLVSSSPHVLPLFTQSELQADTSPRALVLGSDGASISYALVRRPAGPVLGDADVAPAGGSVAGQRLAAAVRDLVAGRPGAAAELVPFGIQYVVAPSASVPRVRSALGRASTLTVVPALGATVWRSSLPTGELTVIGPNAAGRALSPTSDAAPVSAALVSGAGSADVSVGSGAPGRLVVLAEPTSSRWRATVDGHPLQARTAYGWAQAFVLPAGGGELRISHRNSDRNLLLWLELVLVVAAVVATIPVHRVEAQAGGA